MLILGNIKLLLQESNLDTITGSKQDNFWNFIIMHALILKMCVGPVVQKPVSLTLVVQIRLFKSGLA
jgi:hypothetical protein